MRALSRHEGDRATAARHLEVGPREEAGLLDVRRRRRVPLVLGGRLPEVHDLRFFAAAQSVVAAGDHQTVRVQHHRRRAGPGFSQLRAGPEAHALDVQNLARVLRVATNNQDLLRVHSHHRQPRARDAHRRAGLHRPSLKVQDLGGVQVGLAIETSGHQDPRTFQHNRGASPAGRRQGQPLLEGLALVVQQLGGGMDSGAIHASDDQKPLVLRLRRLLLLLLLLLVLLLDHGFLLVNLCLGVGVSLGPVLGCRPLAHCDATR
mmetsp:Transcript_61192/g.200011  ORF Transcript_61192/g.200011 Transcript_61192/m.200011 type:complete len:262 (+) Transcript_61192:971-1756(+)